MPPWYLIIWNLFKISYFYDIKRCKPFTTKVLMVARHVKYNFYLVLVSQLFLCYNTLWIRTQFCIYKQVQLCIDQLSKSLVFWNTCDKLPILIPFDIDIGLFLNIIFLTTCFIYYFVLLHFWVFNHKVFIFSCRDLFQWTEFHCEWNYNNIISIFCYNF